MIEDLLKEHHQEHILRWFEELSISQKADFTRQIESVDWKTVELWKCPDEVLGGGKVEPIDVLTVEKIEQKRSEYFEIGRKVVKAGKVAAVMLAGGQGTRLGSDAPKGMFNIGITRPLYIFEQQIKNLLEACEECGGYAPLFIMTSEKNDTATRSFLKEHNYFGYPEEQVRFFVQEMAPSVDFQGKLLLEEKGRLALSPNGNGGWYSSLLRAKILDDFPEIEWFNAFSVDNVLQRIADPVFVGATIASGKMSGSKGVRKAYPEEKVGVLCLQGGLPSVIEYYDLDAERANLRDEQGNLVYSFGVTLNYLFRADKLKEIAEKHIPVHIVKKKVPYLDERGELISPETENGYKFETLILDMVRLMETCLPFEIVREKEFAPVKNKTGVDSVDTARELLRKNGVEL